ncbi:hypothetical protein HWI79_3758, partial [Cryptosporidium felis]
VPIENLDQLPLNSNNFVLADTSF